MDGVSSCSKADEGSTTSSLKSKQGTKSLCFNAPSNGVLLWELSIKDECSRWGEAIVL